MKPSGSDMHLAWMARYFGRRDYLPLSEDDVDALREASTPSSFQDGDRMFEEGGRASAAFLLRSGPVELRRGGHDAVRCLCKVRPGAMLGDAEMFLEKPYFASAVALGPVQAIRFDRQSTLSEMARQPNIGLRWLFAAMRQVEACQHRLMQLLRKSVLGRVADLLADEHEYEGEVLLTQEEMSRLLGVTRSAVNRAVGELKRLGAVTTGYRSLIVTDLELLQGIANEI